MPKDRFAAREVTRHTLADGEDWVEFRKALTWGEQMRLSADTSVFETVTETDAEGEETRRSVARIDWGIYGPHRLIAYLASWSFAGPDEKTIVPITMQSVEGLSDAVGDELLALLNKHLADQEPLKNAPASTPD